MLNQIEPGSDAARIIEEEERLLARVEARVAVGEGEGEAAVDGADGASADGPGAGAGATRARRPSAAGSSAVAAADLDRELIGLRDALAEAKPEDLAPLVEQMTRLAAIRDRLGTSRALPVDMSSPYFAHMRLKQGPDGQSRPGRAEPARDILIGKRGFIDRRAGVQIVDWRNAPISRVYYRYDEGDDYEEIVDDGRVLSGVVEARRNISITQARLRRIGAPQGTYVRDARGIWREAVGTAIPTLQGGQGSAARAPAPPPEALRRGRRRRPTGPRPAAAPRLGVHHGPTHRADKHLPEIAALIDREQFDLITSPESGLLVIQGGAGSGKTTVALHRIAYLCFADPARFKPSRILFVVPSQALVRYVASVLPALGVRGVVVTTYRAWARSLRQKLLPTSPGRQTSGTPDAVIRLKKHPALLALLHQRVADRVSATEAELSRALRGMAGGEVLLAEWRRLEGVALVPRLRRLYRAAGRSDTGLSAADRVRAESALKALGSRADDILAEWAELTTDRAALSAALVEPGHAAEHEVSRLVDWCAAQLGETADVPVDPEGRAISAVDDRPVDDETPAGRLDDEDDPLLLRLIQLLRGALVMRDGAPIDYAHVAIDEAQDRSAVEVEVLVEATRSHGATRPTVSPEGAARSTGGPGGAVPTGAADQRSVTIAGDTAQRLVFDNDFRGWRELLDAIGQRAAVMRPLRLSYRSTAEVMQLARYILGPDLAPEEPLYARPGAPVEVHELGGVGEAVAFLGDTLRQLSAREPTASVAVIARYPEQADMYYDGLMRAEVPSLRRVRRHDFAFEPGVDVTDAIQVKGLEFDYVVMVDVNAASYPDTVEARHLLHIGVTRAAHQLWLVTTQAPSPLIPPAAESATLPG